MSERVRLSVATVFLLSGILILNPAMLLAQESNRVTHVVTAGENLFRIALRYGVDMNELARVNNIADQHRVVVGQVLLIPGLSQPDIEADVIENPLIAATPIVHVVQPGESLTIIANQYGTTVDQILQANNIANANRIFRGQELNIWTAQSVNDVINAELGPENMVETQVEAVPQNNLIHIVQPGEHLSQIAQRYGMSWTTLAQVNNIANPDQVYAGQEIIIPALNADGGIVDMGIISGPVAGYYVPTPTRTQGRQIVIDLSEQRIYAFEDGNLLRSTLVSTGLPATPTVQGEFRIWHRTESQRMVGPGYDLPNVQWVQYFYQGYGIHGTYWHNNFGQPMSHGCVNLPNHEAEWFYNFGDIGTSVYVQW